MTGRLAKGRIWADDLRRLAEGIVLEAVGGMHERVGEGSVIREQHEAFGVEIESANRKQTHAARRLAGRQNLSRKQPESVVAAGSRNGPSRRA